MLNVRQTSILLLLLLLLLPAWTHGQQNDARQAEARQTEARQTSAPRTITLAPHLTELAFTAGAGDRLVGVVEWSDWPPAALELPLIGSAFRFDLETILSLDTQLALAWTGGTPRAVGDRLEALGVEVLWVDTHTLEEIATALRLLGLRLGTPAQAEQAASDYLEALEQLRQQRPETARLRVFYQVSVRPLYTLGARHILTEVLELCGAENLFADLDSEAAAVDREAVLMRQPDLILAGARPEEGDALASWRESPPVRQGRTRLLTVEPSSLVRPTPRIIEGITSLCAQIRTNASGF